MIHISTPILKKTAEGWRVSATVDGTPLWFKSRNTELAPNPEAFLAALFIPALHTASKLKIEARVNNGWIENTRKLLPIYNRWWGYPKEYPLEADPLHDIQLPDIQQTTPKKTANTASCFTGGVDSFYTLLHGRDKITHLLFVKGFDIPLHDETRFTDFEESLNVVSAETGTTPIILSTNLRNHPLFKQVSWERTHGAALVSIGLLLTKTIDALAIPSSYTFDTSVPWGSHFLTDPMWSMPGSMQFLHRGADTRRREKVSAISTHPLTQKHLRVCWENRSKIGNCSNCEKCLRTMSALEAHGRLNDFKAVFDLNTPLDELIDNLSYVPEKMVVAWDDLLEQNIPESTRDAVERLLYRSKFINRKKRLKKHYRNIRNKTKNIIKSLITTAIQWSLLVRKFF